MIQPTLKDLDSYAFTWYRGLGLEEILTYRGISLLNLLPLEVHLLLRERLGDRQQVGLRSKLMQRARDLILRLYPQVLFALERNRIKPTSLWPLSKSPSSDGIILFVAQSAIESDLGTLLPVIRRIQADRRYHPLVITANAAAASRLTREGIPYTSFYAFPGNPAYYSQMARTALRELHRIVTCQTDSGHAWLLREMRRLGIYEVLTQRIMVLMQVIDAIEMLLQDNVRAVVVASDTHPVGKAVVTAANRRGCPTIVIQAGNYNEGPEAPTIGFLPVSAQTVCVWGEGSAKILRQHGVPPDCIQITGQPRFDRMAALRRGESRMDIARLLSNPDDALILTFASQNIFRQEDRLRALLRSFGDILASIPEVVLVAKLHPAEDPVLWNRVQSALGLQRLKVVKEIDLHRLLAASDVVMTVFSTVGLEALLLGKPLIILTHLQRSSEMRYVEFGAALPADGESLVSAVRSALFDREVQERLASGAETFIRYYASGVDGRATERVTEVIYSAAQSGLSNLTKER